MSETRMSTRGRVVIPMEIRKAMGLDRQTRLRVDREGDRIVLTPIRGIDWRSFRARLAEGSDLVTELEQDRMVERHEPK